VNLNSVFKWLCLTNLHPADASTYNEEATSGAVLERLSWARARIVVIDSGKAHDARVEIPDPGITQVEVGFSGTSVFERTARHGILGLDQTARGLGCSVWMPNYLITDRFAAGIARVIDRRFSHSWWLPNSLPYCVFGRPLWHGSSPGIALFRARSQAYVDDGHTQVWCYPGRCGVAE